MPWKTLLGLALVLCMTPAAQARSKKPEPAPVPAAAAPTKVVLTASDRLHIKVVGEPELSKEYVVDEAGNIQMDMLGNVKAAGLTVTEFQAALEKQLARYIRKPLFTVTAMQRVGVAGGVHTPGAFDFPKEQPIRVMDALLRAGGLTREAKKGRVLLIRRATSPEQHNAQLVDVGRFMKKGSPEDNPLLGPNDMVYVDVEAVDKQPKGVAALLQRAIPLIGGLF